MPKSHISTADFGRLQNKPKAAELPEVWKRINRAWANMPYGGMLGGMKRARSEETFALRLDNEAERLENFANILREQVRQNEEAQAELTRMRAMVNGFADMLAYANERNAR